MRIAKFGSACNGFQMQESDLDITILTNNYVNERKFLDLIYKKIAPRFQNKDLISITHDRIRIPLIRYNLPIKVDILCNNVLGILNTRLLNIYSEINPIVKELVLAVKAWGKKIKLIDEMTLPSYGIVLMCIYFLQLKKIIPSLQKITKEKNGKRTRIKIHRTIQQNLEDFETVADFEMDMKSIEKYCTENSYLNKNEFKIWLILRDFFCFYKEGGIFQKKELRINIKKGSVDFKGKDEKNIVFSMKDPFDKYHNPGRKLKYGSQSYTKFMKEFSDAESYASEANIRLLLLN